jgi:hypothetical protein
LTPALELIGINSDTQNCIVSCYSDSQEPPFQNDKNDCNDLCNPFLSCNSCFGFTVSSLATLIEQVDFIELKNGDFQSPPPFRYTHSIWHPPKLG